MHPDKAVINSIIPSVYVLAEMETKCNNLDALSFFKVEFTTLESYSMEDLPIFLQS